MRQPSGIRYKITVWFYLLLAFMTVSSVTTYGIVRSVEKKNFDIEKVEIFLEDILEVRRMEKNFLLYHEQESMEQWSAYLDAVARELLDNRALFVRLSSSAEIQEVESALASYKEVFADFKNSKADQEIIAVNIRERGNKLTTLTEELIIHERKTIHRLLTFINHSLLFLLPLLVLVFGAVAALLGKGIVNSLKQLEQHAATIAEGNFVELPLVSSNREINSLVNAFNLMSRELKARQHQLVRSEKLASLGTMLAGVAHEFNNPLSNISSSAQILLEELDGKDGDFARELALQISTETNRASAIVNTLLSLAREENFHRDYYPLKSLCQEILALVQGQISKNIVINLAIPDGILVYANKQQIQQVFINLLKNSGDALAGEGTISILARKKQTELQITIRDDGPGIPKWVQKKVFDPFFTTKDPGQGSGLGLFIVHDIIIAHGGSISVESSRDGTAFTIILPGGESS